MKFSLFSIFLSITTSGRAFTPVGHVSTPRKFTPTKFHASAAASHGEENQDFSFARAQEIAGIALDHAMPLIGSAFSGAQVGDDFWLTKTKQWESDEEISNADRAVLALKRLCPIYVRYCADVASDIKAIPTPLAKSLSKAIQDNDAQVFEFETAKEIIEAELKSIDVEDIVIAILLDTLSSEFVADGIEQIYQGFLPDVGMVSIKVQNPALKKNVVKEAELLKNVATVANTVTKSFQAKTDSSEPTAGDIVDKLTSSIFEKTDYTNMEITSEFCTKNVVVTKVAMNDDSN